MSITSLVPTQYIYKYSYIYFYVHIINYHHYRVNIKFKTRKLEFWILSVFKKHTSQKILSWSLVVVDFICLIFLESVQKGWFQSVSCCLYSPQLQWFTMHEVWNLIYYLLSVYQHIKCVLQVSINLFRYFYFKRNSNVCLTIQWLFQSFTILFVN